MGFRYTGDNPILYTQYLDEADDKPLFATPGGDELHPGGVYEMRPAGNLTVPVPPQDGRWQAVSEDDAPAPPVAAAAPVAPPEPPQPPAEPQSVPEPPAEPEPVPDVTGDDSPAQPA